MTTIPQLVPADAVANDGVSIGRLRSQIRSWHAKSSALRGAVLVFLLAAAMVAAVVYTLDRNAQRSNQQQAAAELTGGARVGTSTFSAVRANLRARAGQIAASLDLQQAVIAGDRSALRRIALARQARIVTGGRTYGTLAPRPRIASTALIAGDGRVLARVTIGVALADPLLHLLRDETPLPAAAALMIVQNGRVIAGGPRNAVARIRAGRVAFGSVEFMAQTAPLGLPHTLLVAVEPMSAVDAGVMPYRRHLLLAALITLVLAGALATRLGRPVARLLNDVTRLTHQASTDSLTGLANRRSLDDRLADELARAERAGSTVAYVLADLDDFKLVNDRYGHKTGDEVLQTVAGIFANSVRELDLAARYGGEEFALVLPGAQAAGARSIVERIRRHVAAHAFAAPDGTSFKVTASFGVAVFPTYTTTEALIEAADAALYRAKRNGKNRVRAGKDRVRAENARADWAQAAEAALAAQT